ncbi:hypothetical protein N0V85_004041, partial [Neurospora sp. IMI 360204]
MSASDPSSPNLIPTATIATSTAPIAAPTAAVTTTAVTTIAAAIHVTASEATEATQATTHEHAPSQRAAARSSSPSSPRMTEPPHNAPRPEEVEVPASPVAVNESPQHEHSTQDIDVDTKPAPEATFQHENVDVDPHSPELSLDQHDQHDQHPISEVRPTDVQLPPSPKVTPDSESTPSSHDEHELPQSQSPKVAVEPMSSEVQVLMAVPSSPDMPTLPETKPEDVKLPPSPSDAEPQEELQNVTELHEDVKISSSGSPAIVPQHVKIPTSPEQCPASPSASELPTAVTEPEHSEVQDLPSLSKQKTLAEELEELDGSGSPELSRSPSPAVYAQHAELPSSPAQKTLAEELEDLSDSDELSRSPSPAADVQGAQVPSFTELPKDADLPPSSHSSPMVAPKDIELTGSPAPELALSPSPEPETDNQDKEDHPVTTEPHETAANVTFSTSTSPKASPKVRPGPENIALPPSPQLLPSPNIVPGYQFSPEPISDEPEDEFMDDDGSPVDVEQYERSFSDDPQEGFASSPEGEDEHREVQHSPEVSPTVELAEDVEPSRSSSPASSPRISPAEVELPASPVDEVAPEAIESPSSPKFPASSPSPKSTPDDGILSLAPEAALDFTPSSPLERSVPSTKDTAFEERTVSPAPEKESASSPEVTSAHMELPATTTEQEITSENIERLSSDKSTPRDAVLSPAPEVETVEFAPSSEVQGPASPKISSQDVGLPKSLLPKAEHDQLPEDVELPQSPSETESKDLPITTEISTGHELPTSTSPKFSPENVELPMSNVELPMSNVELPMSNVELPILNVELPILPEVEVQHVEFPTPANEVTRSLSDHSDKIHEVSSPSPKIAPADIELPTSPVQEITPASEELPSSPENQVLDLPKTLSGDSGLPESRLTEAEVEEMDLPAAAAEQDDQSFGEQSDNDLEAAVSPKIAPEEVDIPRSPSPVEDLDVTELQHLHSAQIIPPHLQRSVSPTAQAQAVPEDIELPSSPLQEFTPEEVELPRSPSPMGTELDIVEMQRQHSAQIFPLYVQRADSTWGEVVPEEVELSTSPLVEEITPAEVELPQSPSPVEEESDSSELQPSVSHQLFPEDIELPASEPASPKITPEEEIEVPRSPSPFDESKIAELQHLHSAQIIPRNIQHAASSSGSPKITPEEVELPASPVEELDVDELQRFHSSQVIPPHIERTASPSAEEVVPEDVELPPSPVVELEDEQLPVEPIDLSEVQEDQGEEQLDKDTAPEDSPVIAPEDVELSHSPVLLPKDVELPASPATESEPDPIEPVRQSFDSDLFYDAAEGKGKQPATAAEELTQQGDAAKTSPAQKWEVVDNVDDIDDLDSIDGVDSEISEDGLLTEAPTSKQPNQENSNREREEVAAAIERSEDDAPIIPRDPSITTTTGDGHHTDILSREAGNSVDLRRSAGGSPVPTSTSIAAAAAAAAGAAALAAAAANELLTTNKDDEPEVRDTVEVHPAIKGAINRGFDEYDYATALSPTTVGLGLIEDAPMDLYPMDGPSPKLLSASTFPLEEGEDDGGDYFNNVDLPEGAIFEELPSEAEEPAHEHASHFTHDPPSEPEDHEIKKPRKSVDETQGPETLFAPRKPAPYSSTRETLVKESPQPAFPSPSVEETRQPVRHKRIKSTEPARLNNEALAASLSPPAKSSTRNSWPTGKAKALAASFLESSSVNRGSSPVTPRFPPSASMQQPPVSVLLKEQSQRQSRELAASYLETFANDRKVRSKSRPRSHPSFLGHTAPNAARVPVPVDLDSLGETVIPEPSVSSVDSMGSPTTHGQAQSQAQSMALELAVSYLDDDGEDVGAVPMVVTTGVGMEITPSPESSPDLQPEQTREREAEVMAAQEPEPEPADEHDSSLEWGRGMSLPSVEVQPATPEAVVDEEEVESLFEIPAHVHEVETLSTVMEESEPTDEEEPVPAPAQTHEAPAVITKSEHGDERSPSPEFPEESQDTPPADIDVAELQRLHSRQVIPPNLQRQVSPSSPPNMAPEEVELPCSPVLKPEDVELPSSPMEEMIPIVATGLVAAGLMLASEAIKHHEPSDEEHSAPASPGEDYNRHLDDNTEDVHRPATPDVCPEEVELPASPQILAEEVELPSSPVNEPEEDVKLASDSDSEVEAEEKDTTPVVEAHVTKPEEVELPSSPTIEPKDIELPSSPVEPKDLQLAPDSDSEAEEEEMTTLVAEANVPSPEEIELPSSPATEPRDIELPSSPVEPKDLQLASDSDSEAEDEDTRPILEANVPPEEVELPWSPATEPKDIERPSSPADEAQDIELPSTPEPEHKHEIEHEPEHKFHSEPEQETTAHPLFDSEHEEEEDDYDPLADLLPSPEMTPQQHHERYHPHPLMMHPVDYSAPYRHDYDELEDVHTPVHTEQVEFWHSPDLRYHRSPELRPNLEDVQLPSPDFGAEEESPVAREVSREVPDEWESDTGSENEDDEDYDHDDHDDDAELHEVHQAQSVAIVAGTVAVVANTVKKDEEEEVKQGLAVEERVEGEERDEESEATASDGETEEKSEDEDDKVKAVAVTRGNDKREDSEDEDSEFEGRDEREGGSGYEHEDEANEEDVEDVHGEDEPSFEGLPSPGLDRQDSETIPKAIREGAPMPWAIQSKRREESHSPPPAVQRTFSFPDDIADEEAFTVSRSNTATEEGGDTKHGEGPAGSHATSDQTHQHQQTPSAPMSTISDYAHSYNSLPTLQEEDWTTDDDRNRNDKDGAISGLFRYGTPIMDPNRDSGFTLGARGSPQMPRYAVFNEQYHQQQQERHAQIKEEDLRERGVDLRDFANSPSAGSDRTETGPSSPLRTAETPKVQEPAPESPEDKETPQDKAEQHIPKTLPGLGVAMRPTGAFRSVSDISQQLQSALSSQSPSPAARPIPSNTGVARLRSPEPLSASNNLSLRPDSPGSSISSRSHTSTPPLRRMDKRATGNLRSLSFGSQQDPAAKAFLGSLAEEGEPDRTPSRGQHSGVSGSSPAAAPHQNQAPATPSPPRPNTSRATSANSAAALALGTTHLLSSPVAGDDNNNLDKDKSKTPRVLSVASATPVANEGRTRSKGSMDVPDVY